MIDRKTGLLIPKGWTLERMLRKLQAEMCHSARKCPGRLDNKLGCQGCLAGALTNEFRDWLKQEIENAQNN